MQRILGLAYSCQKETKDENAWGEVVRLVLRTAMYGCDACEEDNVNGAGWEITNMSVTSKWSIDLD